MAEIRDRGLLLRRINFGESSLVCHILTEHHGRIALMARGARRPKSAFRATLEPLHDLQLGWRPGRTGMGTLTDCQRGKPLLPPVLALQGLELLGIVSRLFQEGDPHGFEESRAALRLLNERGEQQGLLAAVWHLLDLSGWLGDLSHCWQCGRPADRMMYWHHARLICARCGEGMPVSPGLRKSIAAALSGTRVRFGADDAERWRSMIRTVLKEHDIKPTDRFKS